MVRVALCFCLGLVTGGAADYLIELLIFLQGGKNMMPRAGQKKVRINMEG